MEEVYPLVPKGLLVRAEHMAHEEPTAMTVDADLRHLWLKMKRRAGPQQHVVQR